MGLYEQLRMLQRNSSFTCQGSLLTQDEWLLLHDLGKPWTALYSAVCSECNTTLIKCKDNPVRSLLPQPKTYYEGITWHGSALWYQALKELIDKVRTPSQSSVEPATIRSERVYRLKYEEVPLETKEAIVAAYTTGNSTTSIATQFHVDSVAVSRIIKDAGVLVVRKPAPVLPELTKSQVLEAVRLYKAGKTIKSIANSFGTTTQQVSSKLRAAGLEIDRSRGLVLARAKNKTPKISVLKRYQ